MMACDLRFELIGSHHPLREEAAHITDNISQPDPHSGPGDAYNPNEQSRLRLLISKGVLNTGSDQRFFCLRSLDISGHELEIRLLTVNLESKKPYLTIPSQFYIFISILFVLTFGNSNFIDLNREIFLAISTCIVELIFG